MMSIFVPKTFGFSAERIKGLVERDLGKVRQIDIVKETCFIHLEKWYEIGDKTRPHSYPTFLAIDRMEKGEAHKITSFNQTTGSYTTLFLLKNHSKKQCQEVQIKEVNKEKDVLEKIEEGVGEEIVVDLKPMSLKNPDSLAQPQQNHNASWRPPSPPGPPPALPRPNRTEGRLATDDQYINKLEKEIALLRTQNHAYVKEINELRIHYYKQQSDRREDTAPADECEEHVDQPKLDANNEYNAKAVPKPRKRAAPVTKTASSVSSDFRLATF
jgi:hypothetical protein